MAQPRVFISHATADSAFANKLAGDLRAYGADVWLDSSHMGAGDFVDRLNNALQSRDILVLVLTPAALKSQWVVQEFNAAITRTHQGLMRQPLVIMAQPCRPADIPPLWNVYHRYEATNDYTGAMQNIARELGLSTPTVAGGGAASFGGSAGKAARQPRAVLDKVAKQRRLGTFFVRYRRWFIALYAVLFVLELIGLLVSQNFDLVYAPILFGGLLLYSIFWKPKVQ